ncbi:hypothetical protein PAXINDRAFT_18099 [Paxillus involutus ATCC 200175]|uniref:Unplaced genomic scaffold PAXINscaffold_234, whole genome shotgun sequence n=1 Tax=Paxillus involutus ATCC 200175 TaxID=664439 RepID=A0A0C9TLY4_PAXIN|nr:hypothetical protein PAXINDRAFT_18099 [Paxillus involutus ATCC 200175]
MAEIPQLRADGRNWMEYREKLLRVAAQQNLDRLYDGTETLQGDAEDWQQRNAIAKVLIVNTIPDSIFLRILQFESAYEFFKALKNLFEQDIATLELLRELRNNRTKCEAAYSPQTTNDRVRTRNVGDASRCDDDVSNRSVRRNDHVPNGNTRRPERKWEPKRQGRVEKRPGVGEEGRESRGRDDEKAAAATGPGKGATDHTADGVSLVKPTSSLPRAQVDSPLHHHNSQPPPQSHITPILLFEQTAPASRRSTHQRSRNGHVPRIETRRTRKDVEWSRRGAESSNRGSREPDDKDGEDVDVHRADVAPQQPQMVGQTAVDNEAADTTDPHANSAGPAVPVGTTNGPPNESNGGRDRERGRNVEEEDEKGGRASESAALSSNDDGGDEDVRHAYVVPKPASPSPNHVPPPPDESRPPPSMSLEGEMSGKQSSDHADEAVTHLERPPDESTTTPPVWTPPDEKSSGEGRGTAMSHREAVGGDDEVEGSNDGRETSYRVEETPNEVDGSDDAASTSYGVDDERSRRGGARDQATGDQEGREVEETRTNEGEECRTSMQARSTTNVDGHGQYTPNEGNSPQEPPPPFPHHPEPPPVPTPTPPAPAPTPPTSPYPERPHVDVDHAKSNKTPARRRADTVHDPGGKTNKPPSVRLEGESGRRSSLHVETDDVETDDLKTCKTAAQRMCADALHDPGGQTDAPDSVPPSVRLEGERIRLTSLYIEVDDAETDNDHPEDNDRDENDHDTQQSPRRPVGTTDGDERRPNGPTEPPDEEKGADGGYGEQEVESTIKHVETTKPGQVEVKEVEHVEGVEDVKDVKSRESRRGDEPRGRGDNGVETREVEGEERGQSEDDGCQRDGRTCDTDGATSGTSHDSKRVGAGPLAEDEASQQRNGKPSTTKHVPGPPTPHPYNTTRPTHHANPPRRRGRLKLPPTNVSQPERTEYAPRLTVVSTTTQSNRMRRKRYGATGGVSQSHHSRGRRAPRPVRRHHHPYP